IPGITVANVKLGKDINNLASADILVNTDEAASIRWEDIEVTINVR
ncbi:TPA: hypothetical protein U0121_002803, partial [Listeria monocytogenes]|nr:hypothetical protein [Listeria monocytogenes]